MTAPYQRRRDPQPVSQGWEAAAAVIGAALLGLGLAALAGLATASALWGGGWVWPHGTDTIGHTLGGLLTGHPGRGLPATQTRLVAPTAVVYGCVVVCELTLIAIATITAVLVARYRRPGDTRRGMATRSEAKHMLGIRTLHSARPIIRPDLAIRPTYLRRRHDRIAINK